MTQEGEISPSVTARAEHILTYAGEQFGMLAGRAALRFRQARQALREEAGHLEAASPQRAATTVAEQNVRAKQASMERAEALIDQLGQRIDHWTKESNVYMKRAMARLREDAEDMLVEAQEMRREWQGKP